jgi:hypothetical protein
LTPVADEQATLVAGRGRTVPDRPHGGHGTAGRGSIGKVLAVVGVLGIFLIVAIVAFVLVLYVGISRSKMSDTGNGNRNAPTSSSPAPTPDNEKQRLQDELANVQKRLAEDEKNTNRAVSSQPTPNSLGTISARVNSPSDGFLALRSQPNSSSNLIVKIPHGNAVTVENCNRNKVTIGGRTGRWCLISWNGYQGYVFDAWLIY